MDQYISPMDWAGLRFWAHTDPNRPVVHPSGAMWSDSLPINTPFYQNNGSDFLGEKASRSGTREENQGFRRRTFHRLFMYNFLNSFVMSIIIISN